MRSTKYGVMKKIINQDFEQKRQQGDAEEHQEDKYETIIQYIDKSKIRRKRENPIDLMYGYPCTTCDRLLAPLDLNMYMG